MEVMSDNSATSLRKAEKVLERAYFEYAGHLGPPGCFIFISWTLVENICAYAVGFKKKKIWDGSMPYTEQIFFLMNNLVKVQHVSTEKKAQF